MFLGSLFASRNRTGSKGDFRGRIFREKEGRGVACIWGVFFFGGGGCKQGEGKDPFWQEYGSLTVSPRPTVSKYYCLASRFNIFFCLLRKGIVWDIFLRGSETAKLIYSSSSCCCHKDSNNIVFVILVPLLLPLFPTNVQQRRLFFRSNRLLRHSLTGCTFPPPKKNLHTGTDSSFPLCAPTQKKKKDCPIPSKKRL